MRQTAFALFLCSAAPAAAEPPLLSMPVDCTLGRDCYIEDYVDNDPDKGAQNDFACGLNSRDGHRGTDFALLSFEAMEQGVAVLAAADGIVARIRDSMPDDREMRGVTSQNACGNAVLVDHQNGWQTLYCHLKQGTVQVRAGDLIEAGTHLGDVGLSGQTNHPHLHLTVLKDGKHIDPFRPDGSACDTVANSLWKPEIPYTKTGIMTAGFSNQIPDLEQVRSGTARKMQLDPNSAIVVYSHMAYPQNGDVLTISATGPQGQIFAHEILISSPRVSEMRAFGKRAPSAGWLKGAYLADVTLKRKGQVIAHRFAHLTVD